MKDFNPNSEAQTNPTDTNVLKSGKLLLNQSIKVIHIFSHDKKYYALTIYQILEKNTCLRTSVSVT